jgi:hypothetical protein
MSKLKSVGNSPENDSSRTGRVNFDDRGNAVWEWAIQTGQFDRNASTQRVKVLTEVPTGLALREIAEAESKRLVGKRNSRGQNPYQRATTPTEVTPKVPGFNPYEHAPTTRRPDIVDFTLEPSPHKFGRKL